MWQTLECGRLREEVRDRTKRKKTAKPLMQVAVTPESVPSSQLICISIWSKVHVCHFAERDFKQGGHLSKATQPEEVGPGFVLTSLDTCILHASLIGRDGMAAGMPRKPGGLAAWERIAVTAFFSRTPSFPSISSPKWCSRSHLCDASCCLPLSPRLKRAVGRSCCLVSCKNRGLVSKRSWVLMGTLQGQAAI